MNAVTSTRNVASRSDSIVLRRIPWDLYERLAEALGDQHIRMAYDRGDLEMMSPSADHERFKKLLDTIVEEVLTGTDRPFETAGETRWSREAAERGIEADECYFLSPEKLAIVSGRAPNRDDDPLPDLAVEVDISPSQIDRPGIYASLGVPEVWRFDGDRLRIDRLREDGTYEQIDRSDWLPLTAAEVERWIERASGIDHLAWRRALRGWVEEAIAPRRG